MTVSLSRTEDILLICGMPASGKTSFGDWLKDRFNFFHLDLESRDCLAVAGLPEFWPARIWNLDQEGIARFFAYLQSLDRGVVLTWAFHTDLIGFVAQLVQAGATPWWFEADRLASRARRVQRARVIRDGVSQPGTPDLAHGDRYTATLVARWSEISPIFGNNVVLTLGSDGTYIPREELWARITSGSAASTT